MSSGIRNQLRSEEAGDSLLREMLSAGGLLNQFSNKKRSHTIAKFTLISSANDGAYALALNYSDQNLLEKMNGKTQKIGMTHAVFFNFTGLFRFDF